MKNKILILPVLLLGMLVLNSCYEETSLWSPPEDGEGVNTILVSVPSMDVVVDATTATTTFNVSVALWGPVLSTDITIPFVLDSTNLGDAAYSISSSDITIAAGSNSGTLSIELVSAEMFPGDVFKMYYSLGQPSVGEVSDLASTGVVTTYNPGLLAPWVGTYNVAAASYGDPGNWDEAWVVSTALDPAAPLTNITMTGIGGPGGLNPVIATIDVDAGTITIAAGQHCGDPYGYGPIGVVWADADFNFDQTAALVGTVNAETGEILIDNWGML